MVQRTRPWIVGLGEYGGAGRHDSSTTRPDAPRCGAGEKSRDAPVGMTTLSIEARGPGPALRAWNDMIGVILLCDKMQLQFVFTAGDVTGAALAGALYWLMCSRSLRWLYQVNFRMTEAMATTAKVMAAVRRRHVTM